jgi:hypothetical protein
MVEVDVLEVVFHLVGFAPEPVDQLFVSMFLEVARTLAVGVQRKH